MKTRGSEVFWIILIIELVQNEGIVAFYAAY